VNKTISILGGGSWGCALAIALSKEGKDVTLWVRSHSQYEEMVKEKTNKKYLPGVTIPDSLNITNDLEKAVENRDIITLAVPTNSIRDLLTILKPLINKDQIFVNLAKGIEENTDLRISQICNQILPDNKYCAISGPSHAEEVVINIPTAVVCASEDNKVAEYVQDIFTTSSFRIYTNHDLIGVELGGALKNIIALGAGISDGVGFGDNSKAALMTRGLYEIAKLGASMGANPDTFSGLAGVGDLIVTCTSMHSRNRKAGILIGQGYSLEDATKKVGMVVEGVKTTKAAYNLSKNLNVEMPITNEIYNILYHGADVKSSAARLMGREMKYERDILDFYKA
jgi:glycerol-3-phosphate dehydrogenase (NAD(P)+)